MISAGKKVKGNSVEQLQKAMEQRVAAYDEQRQIQVTKIPVEEEAGKAKKGKDKDDKKTKKQGELRYDEAQIKPKDEIPDARVVIDSFSKVKQCTWEGGPKCQDVLYPAQALYYIPGKKPGKEGKESEGTSESGKPSLALTRTGLFDPDNPKKLSQSDTSYERLSLWPEEIAEEGNPLWQDLQATLNTYTAEAALARMVRLGRQPDKGQLQQMLQPKQIYKGKANDDGEIPLFTGNLNIYLDNTCSSDLNPALMSSINFSPEAGMDDLKLMQLVYHGRIHQTQYCLQSVRTPEGISRRFVYLGNEHDVDTYLDNIRDSEIFDPDKSWSDTDMEGWIEDGFDNAFPLNWTEIIVQIIFNGGLALVFIGIAVQSWRAQKKFTVSLDETNWKRTKELHEGTGTKDPYIPKSSDEVAKWRARLADNPNTPPPVDKTAHSRIKQMVTILTVGRMANPLNTGRKGTGKTYVAQEGLPYFMARGYYIDDDGNQRRMPRELRNGEVRYFDSDSTLKGGDRTEYVNVVKQNVTRMVDEVSVINRAIEMAGEAAARAAAEPGATPESVARAAAETVAESIFESYSGNKAFNETNARKMAIQEAGRRARITASAKATEEYNYTAQQEIAEATAECVDPLLEGDTSPKEVAAKAVKAAMSKAAKLNMSPSVEMIVEEAGSGWVTVLLDELQVLFEKPSKGDYSPDTQEALKRLSGNKHVRFIGTTDQMDSILGVDEAATDRFTEVNYSEPSAEECAEGLIETREHQREHLLRGKRGYTDKAAEVATKLLDPDKTKTFPRKAIKLLERIAARLSIEERPVEEPIEASDVIKQVRMEVADAMKAAVDGATQAVDDQMEDKRAIAETEKRMIEDRLKRKIVDFENLPKKDQTRLVKIIRTSWKSNPMNAAMAATQAPETPEGGVPDYFVDESLERLHELGNLGEGVELRAEALAKAETKSDGKSGPGEKGGPGGKRGGPPPAAPGSTLADLRPPAGDGNGGINGDGEATRIALAEGETAETARSGEAAEVGRATKASGKGRNLVAKLISGPAHIPVMGAAFGVLEGMAHPDVGWISPTTRDVTIFGAVAAPVVLDVAAGPTLALLWGPFVLGHHGTSVALNATGIEGLETGSLANTVISPTGGLAAGALTSVVYTRARNPVVNYLKDRGMLKEVTRNLGTKDALVEFSRQTLRPVGWGMRKVGMGGLLDKGASAQAVLRQGLSTGVQFVKQAPGQIVNTIRAGGAAIAQRKTAIAGGTAGSVGASFMARQALQYVGVQATTLLSSGGAAAVAGETAVAAGAAEVAVGGTTAAGGGLLATEIGLGAGLGIAGVVGVGLGAGVHYSGLGKVIGTDALGDFVGSELQRMAHPEQEQAEIEFEANQLLRMEEIERAKAKVTEKKILDCWMDSGDLQQCQGLYLTSEEMAGGVDTEEVF